MNQKDEQSRSIALDLKRNICLLLFGEISHEEFCRQRRVLLEKFQAIRHGSREAAGGGGKRQLGNARFPRG